MTTLYDPRLLDDYPKAKPAVEVARKAKLVIPLLNQLRQLKQGNRGRELVQVWDAQQSVLSGRKSAQAFHRDVEQWRQRNVACDSVLQDLRQTSPDVATVKAHWQQLQQLGGHPDADAKQSEVQQLVTRFDAFEVFQRVPQAQNAQNDQALVANWKDALFKGWDQAERQRQRLATAQERLSLWQTLQAVISQHGQRLSGAGEQLIAEAGRSLPDGYDAQRQPRFELAERRLKAVRRLEQICQQPSTSEAELVKAWQAVRAEQAESLVDTRLQQRAELAIPRAPLLQSLANISLHGMLRERDEQLLEIWNDALLDGCVEAQPWRAAYEEACERRALLGRLTSALAANDDAAIVELAGSPLLENWPHSQLDGDHITRSQRAVGDARGLLDALKNGQKQKFAKLFNVRAIQDFPQQFEPYQSTLRDWITQELLRLDQNGLKDPTVMRAIDKVFGAGNTFKLRWEWPEPRITNACLLKICRARPADGAAADQVPATQTHVVLRETYKSAGSSFSLPAQAKSIGGLVVVWAIIEVGDEKFYTEPLVLGRLG